MSKAKIFFLQLWQKHGLLVLIFCLVFGIRFIYTLFLQIKFGGQAFAAFSDAENFILIAQNFLEHGAFSTMRNAPWLPDALRTPLYAFLIIPFLWAKIPLFYLIFLQNILAGVVGVLLFKLGQIFFKKNIIGILAALFYSFEPTSLYWSGLLMPDNIFVFLVVLSLYLFVKKQWPWFAFVMGLAALTRPIALYFFPLFFVWYAYTEARGRTKNSVLLFKQAIAMVCIFLLTIGPWIVRNKVTFGVFEFSSAGWYNSQFSAGRFAQAHNISYPEPPMPSDYFSPGSDIKYLTAHVFGLDFRSAAFRKEQFLRIVKEHPVDYGIYHLKSMIRSLSYHDYEYLYEYVILSKFRSADKVTVLGAHLATAGNILWFLLYIFILLGLFFKEHRSWKFFLLIFIILNNFLVAMADGSWGGRYNLPVAPFMFLLASYGIYSWYNILINLHVRDKRF